MAFGHDVPDHLEPAGEVVLGGAWGLVVYIYFLCSSIRHHWLGRDKRISLKFVFTRDALSWPFWVKNPVDPFECSWAWAEAWLVISNGATEFLDQRDRGRYDEMQKRTQLPSTARSRRSWWKRWHLRLQRVALRPLLHRGDRGP